MKEITPELIREFIDYNPQTGEMVWRVRSIEWFSSTRERNAWNGARAGKKALNSLKDDGYKHGRILYRTVKAHRVAFAHFHGRWPSDCIDHINGDRTDNRIDNLQESSRTLNAQNRAMMSNNKSGVTGVLWRPRDKRWVARIGKNGKQFHLGSFEAKEDAIKARRKAESELGFTERHGK